MDKQGAKQGMKLREVAKTLIAVPAGRQIDAGDASAGRKADSVVEVSDDDYRSFCWPCHALEERNGEGPKK